MALKVSSTAAELNINMPNLGKIEKLLNDSSYSELIEFSANFNTRLCVERKLRMPFLDPQTGVAQNHSNLYMKKSQRMPGLKDGQIYTYPSTRWRTKRNTTKLTHRPFFRFRASDNCSIIGATNHSLHTGITNTTNTSLVPVEAEPSDFQALIDAESNSLGGADTDSKDSQHLKDEMSGKDWFFDDMDANDVGSEEQGDSDYDYSINGYKRKRKAATTRKSSRKPKDSFSSESTRKSRPTVSGSGGSGGSSTSSRNNRRKTPARPSRNNKTDAPEATSTAKRNFQMEPPSFDSIQGELNLKDGTHDSFSAYRKYV